MNPQPSPNTTAMLTADDAPLLKYYGGKWQLAEWILSHFPPHAVYVEPFCGAASVFLRKYPSRLEVLNDLNGDLLNFFDVLRSRTRPLVRAIHLTPFSYAEYLRSFEPATNRLERARRFYVRSWQAYGSGGIDTRSGWRRMKKPARGTSPAQDWMRLGTLDAAAMRLKQAQIDKLEARDCIARYDSAETLFYLDPPYPFGARLNAKSKGNFKRYVHEMSDADHEALAETLHGIQGMAIISSYDSALYRRLYADWTCFSRKARTNGKSDATEYLWVNPRAVEMTRLPLFAFAHGQQAEVQP